MNIRNLNNKTIDELLELDQNLRLEKESGIHGVLHQLVSVNKTLLRKIKKDKDSEYSGSMEKIKKDLVFFLVQYGTYLKTENQKNDQVAQESFEEAIYVERNLPIVYYRLGFLNYKEGCYSQSLMYFEKAIKYQKLENNTMYKMNAQQLYHCYLYLANCGLYIASEAQNLIEESELGIYSEEILSYGMSPFYKVIQDNEQYLADNAYQLITKEGVEYGSFEDCDEKRDMQNTLILDLTSREDQVLFNNQSRTLTPNQVEMFRVFLMKSNETAPLTKQEYFDLYKNEKQKKEVPDNTYIQSVRRLEEKLQSLTEEPVIENLSGYGKTAYYYNQLIPYVILQHNAESFILE